MNSKQPRPSVTRPGARSAIRGSGVGAGPQRPSAGPQRPIRPTRATGSGPNLRPPRAPRAPKQDSGLGDRFGSIRANLQTIVLLLLVVGGILTLEPQAQTWFQERQQIADLQKQVADSKANLAKMKVDLNRWNDPVYIRSQARDRLYYVLPGEVSYLVMGADGISDSDVSGTVGAKLAQQRSSTKISATVTAAKRNWVNSILQSVVRAGLDEPLSSSSTTSVGK